ncbi:type 1 fimbrial protein [Luteibacter pinisoli]|uniref:Type 1 fimbrial protein n=1 Tax=Luteibacter pinisoli TaxID=2589080 RepID=A0A4Y5YY06_9GAMM|nr:fimbrial protein [Luteibacter pinisoli]QDE37880.1 type 1 fimbrial protein [Luteibacter pinisoli]
MNLKIVTSALLIAGLAAPSAFAETGTITFNGKITDVTCSVDGNDTGLPNFAVDLGSVSAGDFKNVGDNVGQTGFKLKIGGEASCADGTKVWAAFDADGATVDPATGLVRVTGGTAKGVNIRLFDENGLKVNAWTNDSPVKKVVADNVAMIYHAASFERVGAITAGDAVGRVKYTINYEAAP